MPTWTGSCQPTTTHEEPVDRPPRRGPVWVPTTHAMVAGMGSGGRTTGLARPSSLVSRPKPSRFGIE